MYLFHGFMDSAHHLVYLKSSPFFRDFVSCTVELRAWRRLCPPAMFSNLLVFKKHKKEIESQKDKTNV